MKLENKQLQEVNAGGFSIGLLFGIGAAITFLIGVVDGFVRPLACHE